MRRGLLRIGCVLLVCCVAGCGGSSHKHAGTGTSPASGSPPAGATLPGGSPPALRAVFGRVLVPDEMKGWVSNGQRTLGVSPASWIAEQKVYPTQRAAETARLKRLGFTGAVAERLIQSAGGPGEVTSIVVGLGSPSAARTYMAREVRAIREAGISAEARPELIPGGKGFVRTSLPNTYLYLLFTRGPYFYSLSANHPFGRQNPPTLFDLIIAANHQYARVGA